METHRILWTDGWRFALTEDERAVQPDYDDGAWRAVDLPHDWQIEQTPREDAPGGGRQGYFPRASVGVYRLRFRAKEAWRGKCVRVLFDGVQRFATVYLNGRKAGGRPYGYLPILCDLTDALRYGEDNVLAVWVDNRDPSHGEWPSAGGDRWYSGAGIYRNVWLLVQEASRIVHDGIRIVARPLHSGPGGDVPDVAGIRCDRARVSIRVELEGDLTGATLRTTIVDGSGRTVYRADEEARPVLQSELTLEHPLLWTLESPALYRASFVLLRGESALDEHAARFGVREAVFDGEDGFVLNGVKTKLWGVNLHHDGGCVGAAVPPELWRRRLQTLKGLGVNAIRASHNPMAEEVYDLCDEMGLLVVDELYDKWSEAPCTTTCCTTNGTSGICAI